MNVYDFDGTIYTGDSTADFYRHCLKKHPAVLKSVPRMIIAFILYILNIFSKTKFKETMYRFLRYVPDIDSELDIFWQENIAKIKQYYYKTHQDSDIVISASPEFLLRPICERLGIKTLIASRVNPHTGKYEGINCRDTEKVRRLYEFDETAEIDEFYSDSLADEPLAKLAKTAYIVRGDRIMPCHEYKPPKYKLFLSQEFLTFIIIGVINTFAGTLFATIYRAVIPNDSLALIPGWLTGNVLSYFLNSICTFRDYKFGIVKYIRFLLSNLPNLGIQWVIVWLLSGRLPSIVVYAIAAVIGVPVTFVFVKLFAFAKKK